jgi:cytochrome c peroxidase
LEEVIDFYDEDKSKNKIVDKSLQRKIIFKENDKKDLLAFLQTLTDKEFLYDLKFRDWVNE